jgi:beta-glucosidase/6-phospho-beta-glucosidase/beta-galactosidase
MTSKQIMKCVLEAVVNEFNVKARANLDNVGKQVFINIVIQDIPNSQQKLIQQWANKQKFELYVQINTYVTEKYQARINAVCQAANAMYTMTSDRKYNLGFGSKQVISYNGVDEAQAIEALWIEDSGGKKAVIDAVFVSKELQLQYA